MKRYALLLAAVVSGSGCVVETVCDPSELNIDWTFVDVDGFSGNACNSLALSADIDSVDIYLDGVFQETVSCGVGGVTYLDFPSGSLNITVEAFAGPDIIARKSRDVSVDSCGATNVLMEAGEAYIDIVPSSCVGGYLWYDLLDTTWSTSGTSISSVSTGNGFPCVSGAASISFPVPYGYYRLAWLEEHNAGGTLLDWGTCSASEKAVFAWNQGTYNVSMYDTAIAGCP